MSNQNPNEPLELRVSKTGSWKIRKPAPVNVSFPIIVPYYVSDRNANCREAHLRFNSRDETIEACIEPDTRAFFVASENHPMVDGKYNFVHCDDTALIKILFGLAGLPADGVKTELGDAPRKINTYQSVEEGVAAVKSQLDKAYATQIEQTRRFQRPAKNIYSAQLDVSLEQPGSELHAIVHKKLSREILLKNDQFDARLTFLNGNAIDASFKTRIAPFERLDGIGALKGWIIMANYQRKGTQMTVRGTEIGMGKLDHVSGMQIYGACASAITRLNSVKNGIGDLLFNVEETGKGYIQRIESGIYQIGISIDGKESGIFLMRNNEFTFGILKDGDGQKYTGDAALARAVELNYSKNGRTVEFIYLNIPIRDISQIVKNKVMTLAQCMQI